jgi:hypothetical protein
MSSFFLSAKDFWNPMSDVYKVLNRVMPACLFCTKLFYFCVVTPKAYF